MKTQSVEEFLQNFEHNQKTDIFLLRKMLLSCNLDENIKWNALNYSLNGNDRITFNFAGKGFFRLIFHCGAKKNNINMQNKLENINYDFFVWLDKERAMIKFDNNFNINENIDRVKSLVLLWLENT